MAWASMMVKDEGEVILKSEENDGAKNDGDSDPSSGDLAPSSYKAMADQIIKDAAKRGKIPIVAGGSSSLIQALVSEKFRCSFLWVHVEEAELREYLDRRVEEMVISLELEEEESREEESEVDGDRFGIAI